MKLHIKYKYLVRHNLYGTNHEFHNRVEKFESTRLNEKHYGGNSIAIDGIKGDAFGIGASSTGNFKAEK